jgi:hypothetical protein
MYDVRIVLLSAAIVEELELIWACCGWRVDLLLFSCGCWLKHGVDGHTLILFMLLTLCWISHVKSQTITVTFQVKSIIIIIIIIIITSRILQFL